MSLDKQVALARTINGDATTFNKTTRLIVAPFLQKLYEIVNDPKTDELIRWSEDGDSFYVLNHERFAREVLGHWFKHQKFTSFVRQLNMYGFHKIPHLQQGVLRSDTDTEAWHFEHPNFRRGQPDLLTYITRKTKSAHGAAEDVQMDYGDGINVGSPQVGALSPGQVLDLNQVVSGIHAIKRHQQAISADLNALKQSNDLLWKEAELQRQRHDKHQDTINRILKFLAGVFGHTADDKDDSRTPNTVVPLSRQRLMIGDGRPKGKTVDIADIVEEDHMHVQTPQSENGGQNNFPLGDQIATIGEPSPSVVPSDLFSPLSVDSPPASYMPQLSPSRPSDALPRASTAASNGSHVSSGHEPPSTDNPTQRQDTTMTNFLPGTAHTDGVWQAAIQQMLNSPDQMQRLMHVLSTQQNHPMRHPNPNNAVSNYPGISQLTPYDSTQYDYARYGPPPPQNSLSLLGSPVQNDVSMQPLVDNTQRLQKTYQDATEIEADMDVLQTSINSLIQNLGIDPHTIHQSDGVPVSIPASAADSMHVPAPPDHDPSPDLFLDALLSGMNGGPGDYHDVTGRYDPSTEIDGTTVGDASTEQLTAFLDEVSDIASPTTHSPEMRPANGYKRKLDVAELPTAPQGTAAGLKIKRKR